MSGRSMVLDGKAAVRRDSGSSSVSILQRKCACGQHAPGGECEECRKEREGVLQRKSSGGPIGNISPIVQDGLCTNGRPLETGLRRHMEPLFQYDLSGIKVHTGEVADRAARSVHAKAYTVGSDMVFAAGQYSPGTPAGRKLIAHELSHTIQQRQATSARSLDLNAAETEADTAADRVASGRPATVGRSTPRFVAREEEDEPLSLNRTFNVSNQPPPALQEEFRRIVKWLGAHPASSPERTRLEETRDRIIATLKYLEQASGVSPSAGVVDIRPFSKSPEQTAETEKLNQQFTSPAPARTPDPSAKSQRERGATAKPGSSFVTYWTSIPEPLRPKLVDSAIDLAIAGIDSWRGQGFPGALWNVFIKPGLLGFLRKLKSTAEAVKKRVIDKIANILALKDDAFNWAFLKGLLKGFFIDGALGIFIAIWDLAKALGSVWDILKDLGQSYPEEIGAFLLKFGVRSRELVNGIGPAIEELKAKFLDPKQSGSLSDLIVEKGKSYATQAGEKLAEQLLNFFDGPKASEQIGEVVGDILGIALWEVVFAALTEGVGTLIKKGTGKLAELLRTVVEGVLKVVAKVQEFFGKVVTTVKQAIAFVKGKLNELGGKLVELLEDAEKFFAKLLGYCVEHSPASCDFRKTQALLAEREISPNAAAVKKAVEELRRIDKSRPGAMKELAGKIHGLRDPEGQAIAVVEVSVDGRPRYAAATNSGAGWAGAQSKALTGLGIEEIQPFGRRLVHAEANVRAWVAQLRSEGKTVQVRRWGVSATRKGDYICDPCRTIIDGLGGTIEEFSAIGKN